jgi:SAM-dependent MidA family methyltransferase
MPSPLLSLLVERIEANGPITVAEFVEQALYHDPHGYYSAEAQRSGREGDFFTSVDVGPVFGELLAAQFAEMWEWMGRPDSFDLVEAAAGNGRLSRDVLACSESRFPDFYRAVRLRLIERSPRASARQREVLGRHASRLDATGDGSDTIRGVIFANELLDALPPHLVVMREDGLREVRIDVDRGRPQVGLRTVEGPVSTPRIVEYFAKLGLELEPGWYAEVNLAALEWVRAVTARLECGFLLLVDYGHEAARLYSAGHAAGTLTTFKRHASEGREDGLGWLLEPGQRDITSHVDLTSVRASAEAAGLRHEGTVDQTYFLLGLGLSEHMLEDGTAEPEAIRRRLALKTLLLPGGLGSTHKVMVFSRGVARGPLRGLSMGGRIT